MVETKVVVTFIKIFYIKNCIYALVYIIILYKVKSL